MKCPVRCTSLNVSPRLTAVNFAYHQYAMSILRCTAGRGETGAFNSVGAGFLDYPFYRSDHPTFPVKNFESDRRDPCPRSGKLPSHAAVCKQPSKSISENKTDTSYKKLCNCVKCNNA